MQKQMSILSKCETELTGRLYGEEKKAFLSFANASNIILGESELDSFIVGFRLGVYIYFELGIDINSHALFEICLSIAVRRSSGKLMNGCLVKVKFNSLRS